MAYIAPIHEATSIRHAVSSHLLSPDQLSLVVAKSNALEVYNIDDGHLSRVYKATIHGNISMLHNLPLGEFSLPDMVFLATERFQYFTAIWDAEKQKLVLTNAFDEKDEVFMRGSLSINRCVVDPVAHIVALNLWEGVLNLFHYRGKDRTKLSTMAEGQIRVQELWIKASAFLPTETKAPKLAFLYKTRTEVEETKLVIYRATSGDNMAKSQHHAGNFDPSRDRELVRDIPDANAKILIPVPIVEDTEKKRYHHRNKQDAKMQLGGLLIVGMTLVMYIDGQHHGEIRHPLPEGKLFSSWVQYDERRFLLGDEFGGLYALELLCDSVVVTGIRVTPISCTHIADGPSPNRTSRASVLVYMGDNMVFVASHHGDSQLILLDESLALFSVIETISNNAPILDFVVMDMGNREGGPAHGNPFASGQTRLIAGCGAWEDGSFRSIRSGVGIDNVGLLFDDMPGITGLFPVYANGACNPNVLLVSFVNETRILRFDDDGSIEEDPTLLGLRTDTPTILAGNNVNGEVFQITPDTVKIMDPVNGATLATWVPPGSKLVTAASANWNYILLSVEGVLLVSLNLQAGLTAVTQAVSLGGESGYSDQIACVHATQTPLDVGVVGSWMAGRVSLINLSTLKAITSVDLKRDSNSASVPRNLALAQLHPPSRSGPTLLVAMEDGNVVNFDVNATDLTLSNRKTVILGTKAARLNILPYDDACKVFATTEHSSLIYSADGRLVYSGTEADDAAYVAPFNALAFPGAVAIATGNSLRLARVDTYRQTHVDRVKTGGIIRRIAYAPRLKVYGMGFITRSVQNNQEIVNSSFELVDEVVFKRIGNPLALNTSAVCETVETVVHAQLPNCHGDLADRFVVGTRYSSEWNIVDKGRDRGRIVIVAVDSERNPYELLSHKIKSHCRCVAVLNGYIIAGLEKSLVVYRYEETTSMDATLTKITSYIPSSFPIELRISGNFIGVMDLLQSLIVVEFIPPTATSEGKLFERARHLDRVNGTALCSLDDEGREWIQCDVNGNLWVLRRVEGNPVKPGEKMRLENVGEINLGEQVNRIRNLEVEHSPKAIVNPEAFLATVEGSIYVFGRITPPYWDLLFGLQSQLADCVQTLGCDKLRFNDWRSYRDENRETDEPYRIVDGSLLEKFLDLDAQTQQRVCDHLGHEVEAVYDIIEELRLIY